MIYLGREPGIPADGWTLHSFADDWIGATRDDDPDGPLMFRPPTVRVDDDEVAVLKASHRRYQTDPDAEAAATGRFWVRWSLLQGGGFWPRDLPVPKTRR